MMDQFSIVIVGLQLAAVCAQRTPQILSTSTIQKKTIGGIVDLDCSVQYAQDYPVVWIKYNSNGDNIPISSKTNLIIKESRYALRHQIGTPTYTLQIKDIQEADAGIYQCQIIESLSSIQSANVELQVLRPPYISENSTKNAVVTEGDLVELSCYADGFPAPKISWRRENNALLPTGSLIHRGNVMKIPSVNRKDRGTYYCVAENQVGRDRRHVNVDVEFAPIMTSPSSQLRQALQFDMDIECRVEAFPAPMVKWLKDGIELSDNQHYRISKFTAADGFTDTTIRIITIEERQYGTYICQAANKLGNIQAEIELSESTEPVCPPACGRAHYGTGALPVSSGPLIAFVLIAAACFRNISTKY